MDNDMIKHLPSQRMKAMADEITTLRARLESVEKERDEALIGKQRFQRTTRAHWEALCAMRNDVNEYVEMPSVDSGPLFSPEDGPIYADIAKRVVNKIQELKCSKQQEPAIGATINGPHGLGVNAQDAADELRARAERAEAALATARRDALEEAAKVCQRISNTDLAATNPPYEEGYFDAADACFHAIRARIAQEGPTT